MLDHLWALSLQEPPQEIQEEKEDGLVYSIDLKKGSRKGWRRFWCTCGSDQDLDETRVVRIVKAGSLEKLGEHLVPAFMEGDLSYINFFLGHYRTFATTQQVLDLLFHGYGYNCPHSARDGGPQDQQKDAISFILKTWMDEYPEDFDQPPHFSCLKLLVEYVQVNMPGSDLERHAHLLCAQLDPLEPSDAEPEGEESWVCLHVSL
nr:ral guanine nucleotide dissociation stimulator-like [Loxodonta africana]